LRVKGSSNPLARDQGIMSETAEIIIGICVLLAVISLTRKYHAWRVKRDCILILEALKSQGALDAQSAIDLPYAQRSLLKMGIRDHRSMALNHLVVDNIVSVSEGGKYYLVDRTL
jgi:hypothetical protein